MRVVLGGPLGSFVGFFVAVGLGGGSGRRGMKSVVVGSSLRAALCSRYLLSCGLVKCLKLPIAESLDNHLSWDDPSSLEYRRIILT